MVRATKAIICHICGHDVKPDGVESYKLITEVELKGGGVVDMEIYIKPQEIDLCLKCAVAVARQGICKLCEQG